MLQFGICHTQSNGKYGAHSILGKMHRVISKPISTFSQQKTQYHGLFFAKENVWCANIFDIHCMCYVLFYKR